MFISCSYAPGSAPRLALLSRSGGCTLQAVTCERALSGGSVFTVFAATEIKALRPPAHNVFLTEAAGGACNPFYFAKVLLSYRFQATSSLAAGLALRTHIGSN